MPDATPRGRPPEVVCFDWGGVILRICRSFDEGVRAAGLEPRHAAADPALERVRRQAALAYQTGDIEEAAFFRAVSHALRGVYSPAEIAAIHDAWLLGEYEGVAALMDELNGLRDGPRTAILSNTNARHWARRLDDFPTCNAASIQLASHELRLAKPDPAIYRAAAKRFGVDPERVVFFDDLHENTEAAAAAGWHAARIDHEADTAAQIRLELRTLGVLG